MDDPNGDAPQGACSTCRGVFCFFTCPYTRPHRARFYWMVIMLVAMIVLWGAALWTASQYGMRKRFDIGLHLWPMFGVLVGHFAFCGFSYDEQSPVFIDNDGVCDRLMVRVGVALAISLLIIGGAFYINMNEWWHEPPPSTTDSPHPHTGDVSTTTSTTTTTTAGGSFPDWFSATPTHSPTPSQTPSPSADPFVQQKQRQRLANAESTIGLLFMISSLCGVATIWLDYSFRIAPRGMRF